MYIIKYKRAKPAISFEGRVILGIEESDYGWHRCKQKTVAGRQVFI